MTNTEKSDDKHLIGLNLNFTSTKSEISIDLLNSLTSAKKILSRPCLKHEGEKATEICISIIYWIMKCKNPVEIRQRLALLDPIIKNATDINRVAFLKWLKVARIWKTPSGEWRHNVPSSHLDEWEEDIRNMGSILDFIKESKGDAPIEPSGGTILCKTKRRQIPIDDELKFIKPVIPVDERMRLRLYSIIGVDKTVVDRFIAVQKCKSKKDAAGYCDDFLNMYWECFRMLKLYCDDWTRS